MVLVTGFFDGSFYVMKLHYGGAKHITNVRIKEHFLFLVVVVVVIILCCLNNLHVVC